MIRELASSIRGNTHADLDEVFFSLRDGVAYIRGTLGTTAEGTDEEGNVVSTFTPDPDLRPAYVCWTGEDFANLVASLDSTALIAAAQAAAWGYAASEG